MTHVPTRLGGILRALLLILAVAAPAAGQSAGLSFEDDAPPVTVRAVPLRAEVSPGDQLPIAVVLEHGKRFHTWPNEPVVPDALAGVDAWATTITAGRPAGLSEGDVRFGAVQWPEPHEVTVNFGTGPVGLLSYSGRAIAYVPLVLGPDVPTGELSVPITVNFQACDDTMCFAPETVELAVTLKVVPLTERTGGAGAEDELFAGFDPSSFARTAPVAPEAAGRTPEVASRRFDIFGWGFNLQENAYAVILLIAGVAGFLLNLTPCVLPVIPIKVLSLQQQAKDPAKLALFGIVYCLGIVATFAVLGLMAYGLITGGQKFDWGQIFSVWWFALSMAVVVFVMGLGMMGLFTIRLPQAVYALNPSHDSLHGNFGMGVLTALLSTPCTGPLLGATIAWVLTQPAWLGLSTFVVMGVGMALPYGVLIAFPRLIDRMPRGGPGGELLKQVMGILLLAVAVFLAQNVTTAKWPWYPIAAIACMGWLWAIVGGWRVLRTTRAKVLTTAFSVGAVAVTLSVLAVMVRPGPIEWTVFANRSDDELRGAISEALEDGKVVVIDFTAKWCVNCHVIEAQVLNSEAGRKVLGRPGVATLKVDLTTAAKDQGWGLVREISGGGGIPLIAIYRPDLPEPIYFQSFFKPSDLVAAVEGGTASPMAGTAGGGLPSTAAALPAPVGGR